MRIKTTLSRCLGVSVLPMEVTTPLPKTYHQRGGCNYKTNLGNGVERGGMVANKRLLTLLHLNEIYTNQFFVTSLQEDKL